VEYPDGFCAACGKWGGAPQSGLGGLGRPQPSDSRIGILRPGLLRRALPAAPGEMAAASRGDDGRHFQACIWGVDAGLELPQSASAVGVGAHAQAKRQRSAEVDDAMTGEKTTKQGKCHDFAQGMFAPGECGLRVPERRRRRLFLVLPVLRFAPRHHDRRREQQNICAGKSTPRRCLMLACCDCGTDVGPFGGGFVVPDKVWDGLGFPLECYACLECLAKRLNPTNPPAEDEIGDEIYRQRKRFKLKHVNKWLGDKLEGEKFRDRYLMMANVAPEVRKLLDGKSDEVLRRLNTSKRVHEKKRLKSADGR
jgi:hypothetical protein